LPHLGLPVWRVAIRPPVRPPPGLAAALLGRVQAGVGPAEQALPAVLDPAGHPDAAGAGEHDQELLAAPAAGHVPGPGGGAQPPGRHAQDLVAGGVAAGVVDLLEPVDVAHQHRQPVPLGGQPLELLLQVAPVAQSGEGVGPAGQLQLGVAQPQLVLEGLAAHGRVDPGQHRVAVQVRHLHVQEHHVGPFPVAGGVTAARATTNTPTSRARCPFTDMRTRRSRLGPIPTW
jgi:hypothetical protein